MSDANGSERDPGAPSGARQSPAPSSEVLQRLRSRTAHEPRYAEHDEIARGGMGAIVRVWDADLRRRIAMKVMLAPGDAEGSSSASAHDRRTSRFLEEAQITGQLDHPGIVPVHELGLDPQGRLFFTMRLVKGRTLSEVIDLVHRGEEGWTTTRALGVLLKVCEAMAFAHDKGVIHRDLKPANVMVGRFGEVYVMDWGLAKVVGREDLHDVRLAPAPKSGASIVRTERAAMPESPLATMDGDIVGTPCYMAPEQARGRLEDIGPHSDVYSLGSILYHLLARHMPYCEKGEISTQSVLALLIHGSPRSLAAIDAAIPDELIAICEKAMARETRDRYPDMLGVAEDLRAFLEGRVVRAHETGPVAELKKWISRNRGFAIALAAASVLAFAGLGGVLWVQRRANRDLVSANAAIEEQKRVAVAEREAAVRASEDLASANARLEKMTQLAQTSEKIALAQREAALSVGAKLAEANASLERVSDQARASEQLALQRGYAASIAAADASSILFDANAARRQLAECGADLRGWEWRHLSARADASVRTLAEDLAMPGPFAVSADGARAAWAAKPREAGNPEASRRSEVRVVGLPGGEHVADLDAGEGFPIALAFDPSGAQLACVSSDRTVRIFELANGSIAATWTDRKTFAANLQYSPDGTELLCAGADRSLRIVVARTGELVRELGPRTDHVRCARYAPDGRRVAAGSNDAVRVYDAQSGELELELRDVASQVNWVAFAPDGGRILAAGGVTQDGPLLARRQSNDDSVRIWNAHTGELEGVLAGFTAGVDWAEFDATGRRVFSASEDRALRVHDLESGEVTVLLGHAARAIYGGLVGSEPLLVSASEDGTVRLWDPVLASTVVPCGHRSFAYLLAFLGDGRRLASVSTDGTLRVTDVVARLPVLTVSGIASTSIARGNRWARCLAASPTTDVLATGDLDGRLTLYDARNGARTLELPLGEGDEALTSIAIARDGRTLAAGSVDSRVWIVDVEEGAIESTLRCATGTVDALAFSADGKRLAVGTPAELSLWDVATGERVSAVDTSRGPPLDPTAGAPLAMVPGRLTPVRSLDFDCEDGVLHSIVDGAIVTRNVPSLASAATIPLTESARGAPLDACARFVTCYRSGRLTIWSTSTREALLTIRSPGRRPESIAVSPDGERVAVGFDDGGVRAYTAGAARDDFAIRQQAVRLRELGYGLVARMFGEGLAADEVARRLESDATLDAAVRAEGLGIAAFARGAASHLRAESWQVSRTAHRAPDEYRLALWQARELARGEPDDDRADFLQGAALYRLGQYELARTAIQRSIDRRRYQRVQPEVAGFLALAEHALGRADEAHAALVQFRALTQIAALKAPDVLELMREIELTFAGERPPSDG